MKAKQDFFMPSAALFHRPFFEDDSQTGFSMPSAAPDFSYTSPESSGISHYSFKVKTTYF